MAATEMYDITDRDLQVRDEELKPKSNKDYKCAPAKKFDNWSCIPLESLVHMAKAFNEENPESQIRMNDRYIKSKPDEYKRYLLKQFKIKLKKCNDQICWTKQSFMNRLNDQIREDIQHNTHLPEGPTTGNKWLSTPNFAVLKQLESVYNDFKFLGALPSDFDKLMKRNSNEKLGLPYMNMNDFSHVENLQFKELYPKKKKIGIIFNLDSSDQPGSHWVAMYSDFDKGQCYFFDSYGQEPFDEAKVLMGRIEEFMKSIGKKNPVIDYCKQEHQRGGSECGVYSISFIRRMLKGETIEQIDGKRVSDEKINVCRNVYFA